jgi:hypothetical protein
MSSLYPGALDSLSPAGKSNSTQNSTDHPTHHNLLAEALQNIENELGVNPSGSYADVAARFAAISPIVSQEVTPAVVSAANVDLVNPNPDRAVSFLTITTGGGSLRSFGRPTNPDGAILTIRNAGVAMTILHAGGAANFFFDDSQNHVMNTGDLASFVQDGNVWICFARNRQGGGYKIHQSTTPPAYPETGDIWRTQYVDYSGSYYCLWDFAYRPDLHATYPWFFVGGRPIHNVVAGAGTTTATSPTTPPNGPDITCPRAGYYLCQFGFSTNPGATIPQMTLTNTGITCYGVNPASWGSFVSMEAALLATAGMVLTAQYWGSSGTQSFMNRWARLTPIMVQ